MRDVLHRCFDLPTYTLKQEFLQLQGGPIQDDHDIDEADWDAFIARADASADPFLVSTFGSPSPSDRALYVVRDGRAACYSYWRLLQTMRTVDGELTPQAGLSLEEVVLGRAAGGHWSHQVEEWLSLGPNVLVVSYEHLTANDPAVVNALSQFLDRPALSPSPGVSGENLAATADSAHLYESNAVGIAYVDAHCGELFGMAHGEMMTRLGYG